MDKVVFEIRPQRDAVVWTLMRDLARVQQTARVAGFRPAQLDESLEDYERAFSQFIETEAAK